MLVRCMPYENESLRIVKSDFTCYGFDHINKGSDSFGNTIFYGGAFDMHSAVSWNSSGIVELFPYKAAAGGHNFIYTLPSSLCRWDENMLDFISDLNLHGTLKEKVLSLNQAVSTLVGYKPNVTDMATTALDVFYKKSGVCQDYAHLLIAFLRSQKIPCRYVSGLTLGEGKTHAWVEVLLDDAWYGFDPTHGNEIEYGYIKLSHGFDVNSCQVSRGVFTQRAAQKMIVHVSVGEL